MFKKLILGIMRRGCSWLCSRGWSRRRGGGKWPGVWWGWSWRWSTCDCARWCGGWTSGGSGTTWSLSQVWLASPVHLDPLCRYQQDSFQPPPPWVISARPQPCPVKMSMNFMNFYALQSRCEPEAWSHCCHSWLRRATSPWSSSAWTGWWWARSRQSSACPGSRDPHSWRPGGTWSGPEWSRPGSHLWRMSPHPKPIE